MRNAGEHAARVRAQHADLRMWQPGCAQYDLVVTHFSLDCFTKDEVAEIAQGLRRCVYPSVRWIVSEFAVPPGRFGMIVARPIVAGLYIAFRFLTGLHIRHLPAYGEALVDAGFILEQERCLLRGLVVSQMWARRLKNSALHPM